MQLILQRIQIHTKPVLWTCCVSFDPCQWWISLHYQYEVILMNTDMCDCVAHFVPHQNQNHRRGWTSASCTRTPLAWWPRWDRRVGGPLGCSHLFRAGDWSVGRRSGVFPLWSAGWRGGGCAWRRPESEGCPLTCSRLNWPEPGYHGSSAHRLQGGKTKRGDLLFFKAHDGSFYSTRFTARVTAESHTSVCVTSVCSTKS